MHLGYTMLCEQTAPKQLVGNLVRAEETRFDFSAFVQIGAERQGRFFEFAGAELLPALRAQ